MNRHELDTFFLKKIITSLHWPRSFSFCKAFCVPHQYEKVLKEYAMTANG